MEVSITITNSVNCPVTVGADIRHQADSDPVACPSSSSPDIPQPPPERLDPTARTAEIARIRQQMDYAITQPMINEQDRTEYFAMYQEWSRLRREQEAEQQRLIVNPPTVVQQNEDGLRHRNIQAGS